MRIRPDARWFVMLSLLIAVSFDRIGAAHTQHRFARLDPEPPLYFTRRPEIHRNPNPSVPLAAIVEFATNKPARARIFVNDDGAQRVLFESTVFRSEQSLAVLGLRPGRREIISVTVTDIYGSERKSSDLVISTDPLPDVFPALEVMVSQPEKMEPGVTLFNLSSPRQSSLGMLVAVNERGEVVWFYRSDRGIGDARRMSNGNLLFMEAVGAAEIDMLGNVLRRWSPARATLVEGDSMSIPVATDMFHHELYEMPSGQFLTLSTELRMLSQYPSSETDPEAPPETADVAGDVLVEFRSDGTVQNQWSLLSILDPFRIGFGSLGGQWDLIYPEAVNGTRDWSHANAIIHDPSDDSMIVSVRHQDAIVKIDHKTGNLIWILGEPGGWNPPWSRYLLRPAGDVQWPYHQHAPMITPRGTLLLFDNGNFRHRPFDGRPNENYSRAVEYSIDREHMTVSEVWSYGGPGDEMFFSNALGDADWMPLTGNVLITDGSRAEPSRGRFARIVEVTHAQPARKVFEVIVRDAPASVPLGWQVYRSERLSSLYPTQPGVEN